MLCTLSGVGFFCETQCSWDIEFVFLGGVGFFFFCLFVLMFCLFVSGWHSEGSRSPGDESSDGIVGKGFHSETPRRSSWGRDKRGTCGRICLSPRDVEGRSGRRRRRSGALGGGRGAELLGSLLLPASQVLQDSVDLLFFAESLKERQQVQQLCVIHVVKPGLNWDSIFWVENIRGG